MKRFLLFAGLLVCVHVSVEAQLSAGTVAQKYKAWKSTWPMPRIHLVFNQDVYAPGDTAFFKCYFLSESLQSVSGKQLLELNLVDAAGKKVTHQLFQLHDGIGYNQLIFPDTLAPGIFNVTVHSSWMLNFNPPPVFQREFTIVGPRMIRPAEQVRLEAFPEGQHLIQGLAQHLVIRSNQPNQLIQLMAGTNSIIGQGSTDQNGLATFSITPQAGIVYGLRLVDESNVSTLLSVEQDGCAIHLDATTDPHSVAVRMEVPTNSSFRNSELLAIVTSRGEIRHQSSVTLNAEPFGTMQIPTDGWPEGTTLFTLMTSRGQVLASRAFYRQRTAPVRVQIKSAKDIFQTREKAAMQMTITDTDGTPLKSEFSVTVLNPATSDASHFLPLNLDILLPVDQWGLRFETGTDIDRVALDRYLIANSKAEPWGVILSNQSLKPTYYYSSVIQKSGVAYFGDTGEPVPDVTQILFFLQQSKYKYQTFTMNKGRISITLPDQNGEDEFFYLAESMGKEIPNLRIRWDEEMISLPSARKSLETEPPHPYGLFAQKARLMERSFGAHANVERVGTRIKEREMYPTFEKWIDGADVTVNVQDYILFPTMEELIKEVIPSIFHRNTGRRRIVRVFLPEPMTAANDPLYIIDGIATKNTSFFLSLKPADLLYVKIISSARKLLPLGMMGKNGIVIVQTKKGDLRELPMIQERQFIGLTKPVAFSERLNAGIQPLIPHFRATLYWNPSVTTGEDGKAAITFPCTDDIGKMMVRVDGTTSSGVPFSEIAYLEVSPAKH